MPYIQRPQVVLSTTLIFKSISQTNLLKQQLEVPFTLTDPFLQAVSSLPHEEGHLPAPHHTALIGQRPGQKGLASARGAMEENTLGRTSFELLKEFWIHEGKQHHLAEALYVLL